MPSGRRGQIKRVDTRVDGRRRAWCEWALTPVWSLALFVAASLSPYNLARAWLMSHDIQLGQTDWGRERCLRRRGGDGNETAGTRRGQNFVPVQTSTLKRASLLVTK